MFRPELNGIHHVRIPVRDVVASVDWYAETLGLAVSLLEEEESEVVGAVLSLGGAPDVGMHLDPERAVALAGFCFVAVEVDDLEALSTWHRWLDQNGVPHSEAVEGLLGWHIDVRDPDGFVVQIHTRERPSVDES